MNISEMLNKTPRFLPIKDLVGDLLPNIEVSSNLVNKENQQILPPPPTSQIFQAPPNPIQSQQHFYTENYQRNYPNFQSNQSQTPTNPQFISPVQYAPPMQYAPAYSGPPEPPNNIQPNQFIQLPKLTIPQKTDEDFCEISSANCNSASSVDSGRSAPYTLHDDLSIFKVVAAYYGFGFHGKIPWSFWQTYKRATGSTRSNSSLYHHWNGSMKKKYDAFISNGRLSDCILWLETAVMAEQSNGISPPQMIGSGRPNNSSQIQHTGAPLFHNKSEPPVSISTLGNQNMAQMQPFSLVRTPSGVNDGSFPLHH